MDGIIIGIFSLLGVAFGATFYFLPLIIAHHSKHKNEAAIGMLNLLLGWTVICWIFALIWAFTDPGRAAVAVAQPSVMQRACPNCGLVADATTNFCAGCGKQLA